MLLLAFGVTASATTLQLSSTVLSAGTAPNGGTGGEFAGTLNGSVSIDVYCIDFSDDFSWGTNYSININTIPPLTTNFTDQTHLGDTTSWEYYNSNANYTALARYEMAGYLTTQYGASQSTNNVIQEAIWTLLDSGTSLSWCGGSSVCAGTAENTDISNAYSAITSGGWLSNHTVSIYTDNRSGCTAYGLANGATAPSNPTCMQEFVTVSSTVPEPSSFTLIGIGGALIGLGMFGHRKIARD